MVDYTSREAARRLGITPAALSKYIKAKKVPAPKTVQLGRLKVQSWTEAEVEQLRKLLPKIANGRKTRYQKQKPVHGTPGSSKVGSQKSVGPKAKSKAKTEKKPGVRSQKSLKPKTRKKPWPKKAVPHKKKH